MKPWTVITLIIIFGCFVGCRKADVVRPYGYLNLRVENAEEDIKWETLTGTWIDSRGKVHLEATSYYFDRCTIDLDSITTTGIVSPVTLTKFYYTDGIDFRPFAMSGSLTITEASNQGHF